MFTGLAKDLGERAEAGRPVRIGLIGFVRSLGHPIVQLRRLQDRMVEAGQ